MRSNVRMLGLSKKGRRLSHLTRRVNVVLLCLALLLGCVSAAGGISPS